MHEGRAGLRNFARGVDSAEAAFNWDLAQAPSSPDMSDWRTGLGSFA